MTRRIPTLLAAFALICASGCGRAAAPRPAVVVISIDTLRSDRLPSYGHETGGTPAIDGLARDSVLFERAFAEVPLTLPSHVSLFTGRIPPRHGVRDNLGFAVEPAGGTLLAEALRDAGYATFGTISAEVLARRTGIARGFEIWDEPGGGLGGAAERPGGAALDAAKAWLAKPESRPRFLFVHLYEPHAPYSAPEPFRSRFADPYDAEIAAADALAGELLAELRARGLYDDALVVLLSDHGEGLGDHGEAEHGVLLYREALQVPLLVKLPRGERAGQRIVRNVALVDVLPTVLERLDLPAPAGIDGLSLFATAPPADRALYSETFYPLVHFGWSELVSAISGDLHLISGRRDELFDFVADPGERRDRLGEDRRAAAALRHSLDAIAGVGREIAPPSAEDAETRAKLGALGYLGSSTIPADRSNLPDPRDEVAGLAARLRDVRAHADEAELAADAALRMLELGRDDAALELLDAAIGKMPRSAPLRVLQSRALQRKGRLEEAARAADEAVALDGALADARYQRAVVALARGDAAAARADLERAAALDPRHREARKALAVVLFASGDVEGAQRRLEEALAIDPTDADARADLAALEQLARGGS